MVDYTELRKAISGEALVPGDEGYDASIKRWSATTEKRAAVVVKPSNAEEVSAAIKFAVANKIPLTACGGGHSSSGTSSLEDGMIIDLRNLRSVSVDRDDMTVTFGGGCLWEDLDKKLDPVGLATVGGVVNHTGVGGLILGGGHGYLTPKHGLTIDTLISAQVVLSDGSIVEASEKENSDLFWAIRGAGAQFGIVTRFTSKVFEQGQVWSGAFVYTADKLPEVVAAGNCFHDKNNRDGHGMVIGIGYSPDGKNHVIIVSPFYHGIEEEGRQFFAELIDIGPIVDNTKMMYMGEVNTLLNPVSEHGIRRLMGGSVVVMPLKVTTLQETANKFWAFCDAYPETAVSVIAIELFPTHKIREVPQEATAYANRGNYYDAVTMFGWESAALDSDMRTFNRSLVKRIREVHGYRAEGKDAPVGRYMNMETDKVKPEDAYGPNLGRLKELKKRFDPENVFTKWHGVIVEAE